MFPAIPRIFLREISHGNQIILFFGNCHFPRDLYSSPYKKEDYMTRIVHIFSLLALVVLPACGTTFSLPEIDDQSDAQAKSMFADAQTKGDRRQLGDAAAEARFQRVARRVGPVATRYCEVVMADREGFNCNARVEIDREMESRNAYFTYEGNQPTVRLSLPLVKDTVNDDEVAFVLAHEYGHLIGRHIEKSQQQAAVGALILGGLAAYANAANVSAGGTHDQSLIDNSTNLGYALGQRSFSQEYELESDTLSTHITADAGYDPALGARYFARPEDARGTDGRLSFWGTHPPDERRIATVLAEKKRIESGLGLTINK